MAEPGHTGINCPAERRLPDPDECFRSDWRFSRMNTPTGNQKSDIGYVVGGSLKENLRVRLTVSPQDIQEGAFVVIDSGEWRYYGLVTDLILGSTDPRFADEQSEQRLAGNLAQLLHGQTLYTTLEVLPPLMR